jgi:imidazolonepropionase
MKLAGRSYLDILAAGGGIMSTVRAVRAASTQDLAEELMQRLLEMAAYGTTTAEVKTGYGLETETELRMFDAIAHAARHSPLRVAATFLGAHALDPLQSDCVEKMIKETLPAVAKRYSGITVDAYCETGAWSVVDCVRYFQQAKQHGLGIRVHTDQFNSLGMIPAALELVARSKTIAVGLPATAFCLGTPCIQARKFIDAGGALALATNANPGSAPVRAIPIVLSFAVREMKMTPAEAITSVTWNAACVLGMTDQCGSIAVGKSADIVLWPFKDERALGYELSGALPEIVMAGGRVITPHSLDVG